MSERRPVARASELTLVSGAPARRRTITWLGIAALLGVTACSSPTNGAAVRPADPPAATPPAEVTTPQTIVDGSSEITAVESNDAAPPASDVPPTSAITTTTLPTTTTTEPIIGDHFVSPTGDNSDGSSWDTAWTELDQIDWSVVEPGDNVLLDGGTDGVTYRTVLEVGASGTESAPVRIAVADEPDRNGPVIFDGGRSTPLPACDIENYDYEEDGVRSIGIRLDGVRWVEVDGRRWNGISIVGHNGPGITLAPNVSDVTLRHIEVTDNGTARRGGDGKWSPDRAGVRLGGSGVTFERVNLHDNGHDAIQGFAGDNGIGDLTIRGSWLHNSRIHPDGDVAFNDCRHADGLQIYSGGRVAGVTIENSVLGPGLTNGVVLGQRPNNQLEGVRVDDVTLRNSVFTKSTGIGILGYRDVKSENWVIDRITAHCPTEVTGVCIYLEGAGHQITDSIFSGSRVVLPDGVDVDSGNCRWRTTAGDLGREADPGFRSVSDDPFGLDDLTVAPESPCSGSGSGIVSVEQLIEFGAP